MSSPRDAEYEKAVKAAADGIILNAAQRDQLAILLRQPHQLLSAAVRVRPDLPTGISRSGVVTTDG